MTDARDRLIVALDLPSVQAAQEAIGRLGDTVTFYKIGYELAFAGGLALTEALAASGKQVFIDLKLHDIPNTVAAGVRSISRLGATFLTVHAYPSTLAAAVEGRGDSALKILGVTVLTSLGEEDLKAIGYGLDLPALMRRRVSDAKAAGVEGVICAPTDLGIVRSIAGSSLLAVTPGVRPTAAAPGDQKRVATPYDAISAGADYLVVGRPVLQAADPAAAAEAIVGEIRRAVHERPNR